MAQQSESNQVENDAVSKTRRNHLGGSLLLVVWLCFVLLYALKPNWAAAIWYWPASIWASLLILLSLPGLAIRRLGWFGAAVALSLGFALAFDDMPRGVLRGGLQAVLRDRSLGTASFMAVSMNCEGGSVAAANEALGTGAELVLLQETPGRRELESLVKKTFGSEGSVVTGPDCSIIARGELTTMPVFSSSNFIWAIWERHSGERYFVMSIRLAPPVFRLNYWNPECWRAYADDRKRRSKELGEIIEIVKDLAVDPALPWIVGGDFNGPPSEEFQGSLSEFCTDSYAVAGRGWGGTGTVDYPLVRFDQIWVRPAAKIACAEVRMTRHSDHRMAVAWVEGTESQPQR